MSPFVLYWTFGISSAVCYLASVDLVMGLRRQRRNLFWSHLIMDAAGVIAFGSLLFLLQDIATKLHLW